MKKFLPWPQETACLHTSTVPQWQEPLSNICLDFHGDPNKAQLVVFSDGNHHMALAETLQLFCQQHPAVQDIFYATTPPSVIVNMLLHGGVYLGNLLLALRPHVFISPPAILQSLVDKKFIQPHRAFMRSRGNVLLVRANNPKQIRSVTDLTKPQVRLFLSNPERETASFQVYAQTLVNYAAQQGLLITDTSAASLAMHYNLVFGNRIHHREAPQALYSDQADVAVVYYHLALRYTRIFPGEFALVMLDGSDVSEPTPSAHNILSDYHLALIGDGGVWGSRFEVFMMSDAATQIYRHHGLDRAG